MRPGAGNALTQMRYPLTARRAHRKQKRTSAACALGVSCSLLILLKIEFIAFFIQRLNCKDARFVCQVSSRIMLNLWHSQMGFKAHYSKATL